MEQDKALVVFQGKKIRRTWFNNEWWFAAVDIIAAITESKDPAGYLKDMRRRDEGFAEGWGQIATPLLIDTVGGKQSVNCVSVKGAFRLIQSVPSPKAEPFKLWLAQVGYERVQEIENPELAQKRMKEIYKQKGYSDDWIEKRVRGIAIRDELTDEWKKRKVETDKEFAILTAEISKATFGMTPSEYQKLKGLKKENLRDHMNDLELIFTMLGERVTTEITRTKDAQEFDECSEAAKEGGEVAGNAKKDAERKIGKPITTSQNYLEGQEKGKRKQIEKKPE
ncbi:MAG: Bro-N domain-containing protein [Nanoarchaeota archaeon]|nr:Bro-N domain-containing protein [Nanoarchaeota archaeon]MBU1004380.1 Bro-N domain-containing protein [Nanoarchaeota archaeon]MBU1946733.1 Bro-N domain-containing protein [Nanoarchaeota archaeon]